MIVRDSGPHIVDHLKQRIESLKTALDLAQQRIDELEECLGATDDLAPLRDLGLSPQEARVVNILMKRDKASPEMIVQAIYLDDPERKYDVLPGAARVVLSHARRKLAKHGVRIERGQPRGPKRDVSIPPEHKRILSSLIGEAQAVA